MKITNAGADERITLRKSVVNKKLTRLTTRSFVIGSCCWYACLTHAVFHWLHDMTECCHFGFHSRNQHAHNYPCRLRDGTGYSSCLLSACFSLIHVLKKIFAIQLLFSCHFFWTKPLLSSINNYLFSSDRRSQFKSKFSVFDTSLGHI